MDRGSARYRSQERDSSKGRTAREDSSRHHARAPHDRHRDRSRSRSPRRRSRSPHGRPSTHRDASPSQKTDGARDRHGPPRGRSASRSRSRDSRQRSRRERSRDGRRRSASASSSDSEDSEDRRRKRRKEKRRRERSGSRERVKKDKKSKKEKKEKKKHKNSSAAVSHQWGKFGIINETDLYNKEQEFRAWLVEERKINPETVSKDQTKKEFARFVEDYNTATLPHEKFYHMEQYERRMAALRAGEYLPPADDSYDPNADMKAHQSTHKRRAVERETYMSKDQLMELRKVQNERIEAGKMKLLGMEVKQNMGVRMDGTMFDG